MFNLNCLFVLFSLILQLCIFVKHLVCSWNHQNHHLKNHVCDVALKADQGLYSRCTIKDKFHQNTNISLCCLICMELPSPFAAPSTFVPCLLRWVQRYQNNIHFKVREMPLHSAACASLSHSVKMERWKSQRKPARLYSLVFRFFLYSDHSCLH